MWPGTNISPLYQRDAFPLPAPRGFAPFAAILGLNY